MMSTSQFTLNESTLMTGLCSMVKFEVFCKKCNAFINQGYINMNSKTIMLQKISISNKCSSFELSINKKIVFLWLSGRALR